MSRVLRLLLLGALLAYFVFGVFLLILRHVVLPDIDQYRAEIAQAATDVVGQPVLIGRIDAAWRGLRPQLVLQDVVVRDQHGGQALHLPQVTATVSWWSLVVADLRLHALEIVRPDLDILRDQHGRLYVAGMPVDSGQHNGSQGMEWVLSQREISIREGSLRWNDALRSVPQLTLNSVNIVLRNQGLHHRLAVQATPPAEMAAPVTLRADFHRPYSAPGSSDFRQWKGMLYVDWRNADLTAWSSYFDYPVEVRRGRGDARAWLDFDAMRIADFTADLALTDVAVRLENNLPVLDLARASGRITARETDRKKNGEAVSTVGGHGYAISLTDFSLETRDGVTLPSTTIAHAYTPATGERPERNEFDATLLDIETLAKLAAYLPLSDANHRLLADFAPRGVLRNFSARWQGLYPHISSYRIQGHFTGLSMSAQAPRPGRLKQKGIPAQAAVPGIPGFENLSGHVNASEEGGHVSLAATDAVLDLPGYLSAPQLPFEQLNMQAKWGWEGNGQFFTQVDRMDFVQHGTAGTLSGRHVMPQALGQGPGMLDLTAKISAFDMQKLGRYLPVGTPDDLRYWLSTAMAGGQAQDVTLRLKGNLADFPFHQHRGQFLVSGRIHDGMLNYAPGDHHIDGRSPQWPLLEQINGSFEINRTRLTVQADSASTHQAALSKVHAEIPDLLAAEPVLQLRGKAASKLQNFIGYVNSSPVSGWIGSITKEAKGSGDAKLSLELRLPLKRMEQALVQGTLEFADNEITLFSSLPPLQQTSGKLRFDENGFSLSDFRTVFLGSATTLSGGTGTDGKTEVRVLGTLSPEALGTAFPDEAIQRLMQHVSGATPYSVTIQVKDKLPEIVVESTLQGLGLDFPAPLHKSAADSLPLRFRLAELPAVPPSVMRDEIQVSLGNAFSAHYLREKKGERDGTWKLARGGIGINTPATLPDSGLFAYLDLQSLDIDAWRNTVHSIVATQSKGAQTQATADASGFEQYIVPDLLAVRATQLHVLGKKLDKVVIGGSRQNDIWQFNIDSDQASGHVTWAAAAPSQEAGKLTARLASLIIPKSATSDVSDLLQGEDTSTQLPSLDIVADSFELSGKRLGSLQLVANNSSINGQREWHIEKLAIRNASAAFNARGKWTTSSGHNLSSLVYTLDIAEAGKLLDRFDHSGVLNGGSGRMSGEVSWKGLPFSIDISSLAGEVNIDVAHGQFLQVDPGAAKLLGVLSLQSLPRRLTLDFRDLFSKGFAFDSIAGTAQISGGVMRTNNLKMRSINAAVLLEGSADIARETQNLRVVVVPEINVGGASVVYGLLANPVIGLGSFLAQLFLQDPLREAFTLEYKVDGPWSDPAVHKIERKLDHEPVSAIYSQH